MEFRKYFEDKDLAMCCFLFTQKQGQTVHKSEVLTNKERDENSKIQSAKI